MLFNRSLLGALLISLAACAAPLHPVAPAGADQSPAVSEPISPELAACVAQARAAARAAARPGEASPVVQGCTELVVANALSPVFDLTRVLVVLAGSVLFDRVEPTRTYGPLATTSLFRVFLGPVAPGEHTLTLFVNLQGNGTGSRAYLRGYRFEVRASYPLTIASAVGTEVRMILYEKGTSSTPLEERPVIRFIKATGRPLD